MITLATAGLSSPPALAIHPAQITLAYITSDQSGARQVIRRLAGDRLSDGLILTLPPIQPRAQTAFPGLDGTVFLLWLDLDGDSRLPALFSALIAPTGEIVRGPLRISAESERVYDYSAVLSRSGSVWAAWSGTTSNEAEISLREIDSDGRPGRTVTLATDALHPALISRQDGTLSLFYQEGAGDGIIHAHVAEGVLLESARITSRVSRTAGTLIQAVYAGISEEDQGYLFVNLSRDDGRRETWMTSGALNGANWSPPEMFPPPYYWVRPLQGSIAGDLQLAAADDQDAISIVTLRGGQLAGVEAVTRCTPVIEPPALYRGSTGLILAWSQPNPAAPAALQITSRPGS